MVLKKIRRAKRVRLARIGLSASALAAMAMPVKLATPTEAKTPGSTYCYYGVCHRVKTIEETQSLVGVEEAITASHYDDCANDRYNPCGLTSSGERFHADRPDNTASPVYPDGTMLLVWNPQTERALVVRVNNAGPYWGDRRLDLSRAAAERLGFEGAGVADLKVRVIKAPEPEETVYSENRNYPPVPGDIGVYRSIDEAERGMVVAMALQASSLSPMAPVTAASVFTPAARSAEPLVAEAPQSLGRGATNVAVHAAETAAQLASLAFGGLTTQSLRPLRPQTMESLAALDRRQQSLWDEDATPAADSQTAKAKPEEPKVAANDEPSEPAAKPAAQKVAAVADDEEKAPSKRVEQSEKPETAAPQPSRSRKAQARKERAAPMRVAKADRVYAQPRDAEQAPSWRSAGRERTAEQATAASIRAQSSSTM